MRDRDATGYMYIYIHVLVRSCIRGQMIITLSEAAAFDLLVDRARENVRISDLGCTRDAFNIRVYGARAVLRLRRRARRARFYAAVSRQLFLSRARRLALSLALARAATSALPVLRDERWNRRSREDILETYSFLSMPDQ